MNIKNTPNVIRLEESFCSIITSNLLLRNMIHFWEQLTGLVSPLLLTPLSCVVY